MALGMDSLAQYGEDALANHFVAIFPADIPGLMGPQEQISLRITNFTPPDRTLPFYEVYKDGKKMSRVGGVDDMDISFTFNYRPDKWMKMWQTFNNWMNLIKDLRTGARPLSDIGEAGVQFRRDITVVTMDANNNLTGGTWIFQGCFPQSQSGVDFDVSSGDPMNISVTMHFMHLVTP
jgi:hypothetical protein